MDIYATKSLRDFVYSLSRVILDGLKPAGRKALASVIGEDELSPIDKKYLEFGREFEKRFIGQDIHDNRTIIDTLNIGWELLGLLPREELDRIDTKILDKYYKPADAASDAS